MKATELYKGMKVRIETSFHTRETHTVNRIMECCIGRDYIIEDVENNTGYGLAAVINGYYWHAKDLVSLETPLRTEKVKVVNFNIKELVL